MMLYSVTVIDLYRDPVVGIRRTPAIFEDFWAAHTAVINNLHDLADGNTYQYAVIEETYTNVVRPAMESPTLLRWWYKYNAVLDEFVAIEGPPPALVRQSGFGIG